MIKLNLNGLDMTDIYNKKTKKNVAIKNLFMQLLFILKQLHTFA